MRPLKIAYEPHPVTPERKAELKNLGYRIVDARFAPKTQKPAPLPPPPAPPPLSEKPTLSLPGKGKR